MASINIPSTVDDPNYRYKMPRVRAKIEGRGNGIKTNIVNMGDIARALKRPPEYPTRFCGCELGSSSKFEVAEGKAIVNGAHTEADIQIIIDKFVERFVLCPNCRLPEIDLRVHKGRVQGNCNACGFSGDMDNTHKVGTYIVKNLPDRGTSTMGSKKLPVFSAANSVKKTKEERQRERAERALSKDDSCEDGVFAGEGHGHHSSHHHSSHHSKHEHTVLTEEEASKKAKKKAEKKAEKKAAEKKKKKSSDKKDKLLACNLLTFDSPEIEEVITRLDDFLHRAEKPLPKDFFQEVRLLQVAQDFNSVLRVYVALCSIFPASIKFSADEFHNQLQYLASVCDRSIDGETILSALEEFISRHHPAVFAHQNDYSRICADLYNSDLVDEESFLTRYGEERSPTSTTSGEQGSNAQEAALSLARKAVAIFVHWLEAAESASESEKGKEEVEDGGLPRDSDDEDEDVDAATLHKHLND